jgi:hypothetical protein
VSRRCARRPGVALLLAGMLASSWAHADVLYVVEQLVVNVNSAPDATGERIATVKSGDSVEVLERQGDQIHVRLANGKDGWVRASYLSSEEPSKVRLAQRDAQLAQLKEDASRLQAQLTAPRSSAAPAVPPAAVAGGEDPAGAAAAGLFAAADERPRRLWPWVLGAALIGLGAGFALGLVVLDRHIRRKYGGLRIY